MPPERPVRGHGVVDAGAWLEKAMEHRDAVAALLDRSPPLMDPACLHMHLCVETALKAALASQDKDVPETHDLTALLDLLGRDGPTHVPRKGLMPMSDYAATMGYPGSRPPTYDQLDGIIEAMDEVLGWAQREVG